MPRIGGLSVGQIADGPSNVEGTRPPDISQDASGYQPTHQQTNQPYEVSSLLSETSAAARTTWSGQDGAIAWAEHSTYPREAGIAGRRFAGLMDRLPLPALWYAVAEAASEGHHAAGSCREDYLRNRCARIGETLRDMEKRDELAVRPARGLRPLAVILAPACLAAPERKGEHIAHLSNRTEGDGGSAGA